MPRPTPTSRPRRRPARLLAVVTAGVLTGGLVLTDGPARSSQAATPTPTATTPTATTPTATTSRGTTPPRTLNRDLFDHAAKLTDSHLPGFGDQQWYLDSIPFLDLPAQAEQIQDLYYYRWQVTKEQTKYVGSKNRWVDGVFINSKGKMGPNSYLDLRWLRERGIVENDVAVHETAAELRYTDPTAQNLLAYAEATGDTAILKRALPDLILQWNSRREYYDPKVGLYWHQPVWDATEHTIAARQVHYRPPSDVDFANPEAFLKPVDQFFGGWGYSAPLNAAQAADADAIGRIATLAGEPKIARTYAGKGRALQRSILSHLWDPNRDFFYHVMKDNVAQGYDNPKTGKPYPPGTKLNGREIFGYYPWQFGLVPDRPQYAAAWKQLLDPQGFGTAFGPSTAEIRNPDTDPSGAHSPDIDNGNCCRWDGPAWPYTHARTLQALATFLDDYRHHTAPGDRAPAVTAATYVSTLARFAALERKDGAPYTGEAADSVTGKWIYDTNGRSNANNQYPVDDTFVTGLVGLRPGLGRTVAVKPLTPPSWRWWALENLPYHGHLLKIVYDADGRHYGVGRGLSIWVDGRLAAHRGALGSLLLDVGRTGTGPLAPASVASRYDGSRTNWAAQNGLYPQYSASLTPNDDQSLSWAFDGTMLFDPKLAFSKVTTTGSPDTSDWLAAEFGSPRPVDEIRVAVYADAQYAVPAGLSVQQWNGTAWVDIPNATQTPNSPQPNTVSDFRFPVTTTSRIRVVTAANHQAEAISDIEAWGPSSSAPVNCPSAGPQHYEAENGVTNLGNAGVQAPQACGWGVVGGLNTTKNYFVDDPSKIAPGDLSGTTTGPLWQGFTGTSWVDLYVDVPASGNYTATLRCANGIAGQDATEQVTVDDRPARTVTLPPTGGFSQTAGAIKTAAFPLSLSGGRHRIRIAVRKNYAEFDSLDLDPVR